MAVNFSLSTTVFVASHRFWIVLSLLPLASRYFLISSLISSVVYWLFGSMLFSLQVFVFFAVFSLLMSSLIALWAEKMLDCISIFLNLLRLDLWPRMWSMLGTFHRECSIYTWEECVFCCFWMEYSIDIY